MKAKKLKFLTVAAVVAVSLGLAGCGGGGTTVMPDPGLTPYERATAGIAAANSAEAAQAAYDAVKDDVTATEGARLQAAVDARIAALAMTGRASDQRQALMTAAGRIDTSDLMTAQDIAAANSAIAALKAAIAAAVDVDDTSMYEAQVATAEAAVAAAQSALDHDAQTMALSDAVADLQAIDLGDLSTQDAIDAAEAAIDALEAALDAATELSAAEKAVAMTVLGTANRTVMMAQGRFDTAAQKMALADAVAALGALDLDNLMTQEQIDAAVAAITGVNLALEAATHLTDAEKLGATVDATVAQRKVDRAEMALADNVDSQRMALSEAGMALAALDLDDLDTQAKIDAADAAVMALKAALDMATHLSDSEKAMYQTQLDAATETVSMAQTGMDRDGRMMAQRTAITDAVTAARMAVGAVNDSATDDQVMAADDAIAALKTAIDGAADLPEGDTDVATAQGTLTTLEGLLATAKTSRMAAMDEEQRMKNEEMAKTAAKLFAGISEPKGDIRTGSGFAVDDRTAAYNVVNDTGDPVGGVPANSAVDTLIMVSIGDGSDTAHTDAVPLTLMEDKKAMVAKLHGWAGKRYTAEPDGDGMYEAVVYSNVGEPTQGRKFGSAEAAEVGPALEYAYLLVAGEYALDQTAGTGQPTSRVTAIPSFDLTAGTKEYPLPTNRERVMIPGSYHGVPGTYYCVAGTNATCAVRLAADGFRLGETDDSSNSFTQTGPDTTGGTWNFKPTDRNARVTGTPDAIYASYGWWIHKSEDGNTYTASAFVDNKGEVPAAAGLDDVQGTATYMGGAAGKYALSSSTGGANDAGHFTARATLEADFSDNKITGTIDMFKGADGMDRDWSVELKEADVAATGGITREADNDTVWTIDGTAAAASGEWMGTLYDTDVTGTDTSGVPKVGTGTFYTEYGSSGKMVGAFGVNKQ